MFGSFYPGSGYYGIGPIGTIHIVFINPDIDGIFIPKDTNDGTLVNIETQQNGIYIPGESKSTLLQQEIIENNGIFIPNNIKNGRY